MEGNAVKCSICGKWGSFNWDWVKVQFYGWLHKQGLICPTCAAKVQENLKDQ